MPALKICPFCMVNARTDAACCSYCGSRYDRVALASPRDDEMRTRRRTYDGTHHDGDDLAALCISLDAD